MRLRGVVKVSKRYLLQTARNLGLILGKLFRMGTTRGLQPEGTLAESVYFIVVKRWPALGERIALQHVTVAFAQAPSRRAALAALAA
jgi:hypothetical protein